MRLGLSALQFDGEDRAGPLREVAGVERMVGMGRQRRMVDAAHLGMRLQEIHYTQGILHMAFHTERKRFESLQQQEGIERTEGRSRIAQQGGADAYGKGGGSGGLAEAETVVAGIRLGELREFARCLPVERTPVDDDTAQRSAVSADELGGRVYHDVGPVLDRTDEAGRTERIINHQRNAVPVGNGGYFLQRVEVGIGVAHGLEEDGTGSRGDGGLEVLHVGRSTNVAVTPYVGRVCASRL